MTVLSLALVTVYFRESDTGTLHDLQSTGASVLRPFEVGAERIARPFRDAAGWVGGVLHAKSENKRLKEELDQYRQQIIVTRSALRENAQLKELLRYLQGPTFPQDYRPVAARVIARAPTQFQQQLVVSAGIYNGIAKHDPVVTADGLVGEVTKVASRVAQITLLSDPTSAVSALDIHTNAAGIYEVGESGRSMALDRVSKDQVVNKGDIVVTSGFRSGDLSSLYPRGIPLGVVTSVSQADTDIYKRVQVDSFVDFSNVEAVIVLAKKGNR
ncbi:MAG TPA: rod shape-determining protein MreC [Gaiellaceae bacterium]|nr:rod shape-determining protein MreC [Gaiellaceae bacterium]